MKVWVKLASWKMKLMSRTARALLIQTVAATIPSYVMQSSKLPSSTLSKLEQLSRDFLWATADHRGLHHMAWAVVCQPKRSGGLGIPALATNNHIALARLCWRLLSHPSQLWSQVLMAKYGGLPDLQCLRPRAAPSHIWRSIRTGWTLLRAGLCWQLGYGTTCLFWLDSWVDDVTLVSLSPTAPPDSWVLRSVSSYWTLAAGWCMDDLQHYLAPPILTKIRQLSLLSNQADVWRWRDSPTGWFTSASARQLMHPEHRVQLSLDWTSLWKFKGPLRASMTLWLIQHGRLPTADHLWRKIILPSPCCSVCGGASETALHALRDCPCVCRAWELLLIDSDCVDFWQTTQVDDWVKLNLSVRMHRLTGHLHWKYIFRQCVQDAWTRINFLLYRQYAWPGYYLFVKQVLVCVLNTITVWHGADSRQRSVSPV